MPHLPQTLDNVLDTLRNSTSDRVPREAVRAVRRVQARSAEQAARIEGRGYVTRLAMFHTALLTKDEETFIQFAPLGEARYKALADAYAIYATGEVGRP